MLITFSKFQLRLFSNSWQFCCSYGNGKCLFSNCRPQLFIVDLIDLIDFIIINTCACCHGYWPVNNKTKINRCEYTVSSKYRFSGENFDRYDWNIWQIFFGTIEKMCFLYTQVCSLVKVLKLNHHLAKILFSMVNVTFFCGEFPEVNSRIPQRERQP